MVKGQLTGIIDVAVESMPQLAVLSMSENSWGHGIYDLNREITCSKRKSQRISSLGYDLDFTATLSWRAYAGSKTFITISIKERENNCSVDDCKSEAYDLIRGIHSRAQSHMRAIKELNKRTTYGDARWATESDLANANYITSQLQSSQLLLGPYKEAMIGLPEDETERHAIVCGPTGCGKTSTLFVPNLLERADWSALVTEATAGATDSDDGAAANTPDLMSKTAGYRASLGHKIYYFNPDDLSSHRINPIDGINTIRQAIRLANLLIKNTNIRVDTSGDPFWETAETALLSSLIMHTASKHGHLGQARALLRDGPEPLADILQTSPAKEAQLRYKEFLTWSTEATRNSIVIGLMQRLELWTQPSVVALTEKTDVDFSKLKDELFTFYLAVPADKPELKPCAAIIFAYLTNYLVAKKTKHRVSLYLDEFTNFGYLPDFPNRLSIIRHRHIPAMLGLQDYAQAEEIYKTTASTLFSQPATRIYFKPQTLAQAKIISESLGVETVYERHVSSSCQIQEREFGRDLMTPGAVQMLERGHSIVFTPSTYPLKLKRFLPQKYNEKTALAAPTRRILEVNDSLVSHCLEERRIPEWQKEVMTKNPPDEPKIAPWLRSSNPAPATQRSDGQYNEFGDRVPKI